MRTASLVLGIIGGVFGIIAGLLAMLFGGASAAFEAKGAGTVVGLGIAAVFIGIVGIVGGSLALRYPRAAAILQLASGLFGFIAVSLFWIFSGILLIIGAALAFFGREKSRVTLE
jgi:hypothetical protein